MGGEVEGGAGEDAPVGGGVRGAQGRTGRRPPATDRGIRDQDEAHHHQGRAVEKGKYHSSLNVLKIEYDGSLFFLLFPMGAFLIHE